MKLKLPLLILLFTYLNCFSQSEKRIHGKVVFNQMPLEKIDIVNLNSKRSSTTDTEGKFSIEAKVKEVLLVLSKDFYDIRITITSKDFDKENFIINLEKKPIELEEVTIINAGKVGFIITPEELAMGKLSKYENSPKVVGVYTGEMPYGSDIIGIFMKIFRSKKKKDTSDISKLTNFKEYALSKFDKDEFFIKKLNIKPEELFLFFSYCEKDLKSQPIIDNQNELETMDFLISKNIEFKKLGN